MACADFLGFALLARVEAADDALQFGELFHHLGGEVGLGEEGGPGTAFLVGADDAGATAGERDLRSVFS